MIPVLELLSLLLTDLSSFGTLLYDFAAKALWASQLKLPTL
jgi:hypothetical protein